jgi:hypothetical protein
VPPGLVARLLPVGQVRWVSASDTFNTLAAAHALIAVCCTLVRCALAQADVVQQPLLALYTV